MERHSAVGAAVSMQFIRHNWRSSSKIRKLDLSLNYNVCLAKLVWTRQSHASSTEHCPVSWQWCCVAPCYPLDEAQLRSGCWISQSPSLTWHGPHGRVGLVRGEVSTEFLHPYPAMQRCSSCSSTNAPVGSRLPMCILILISPVSARKRHTPLLAGCLRCCTLLASFCCKVRLKTHKAHMAEH